jgi:hypothetical protein
MYPGFQLSNILQSIQNHDNILYQPHFSLFDVMMTDLGLSLCTIDPNTKEFFNEDSPIIGLDEQSLCLKSYSIFLTNNPLLSIKNNSATAMHLNSIFVSHDSRILDLKKEDIFLICNNTIRPNDTLLYFPNVMSKFNCNKIVSKQIKYGLPSTLQINNDIGNRKEIALFCYNKKIDDNYLENTIGIKTINLNKIPSTTKDACNILNNYKVVIELDPASIVNALWAIACGCVAVIIDMNNSLSQYQNISNLYIVNSIGDLAELLRTNPVYSDVPINHEIISSFEETSKEINTILNNSLSKAFII